MSAGPDGGIDYFIHQYFSQRGWQSYKMDQGGGVFDRLLVSPKAFHLYVEAKRKGVGGLRPQQEVWGQMMQGRINHGRRRAHVACIAPINSRDAVRRLYERFKDC